MIGKTIGRYRIIDRLGEGGMGAVWKAEDTTLHRLVALKTLAPRLSDDEEAQRRFLNEAQAASALNHPNITTIHDLIEDEGRQYICMEYIEGKTIQDLLESGHVSVRKAVDITLQCAKALRAAHQKGILHRDIKSANIMVTMEGNAKVMDFGLAHLEEHSRLTRTGTTMGTLAYSSPEQLSGRSYDERSEIWALGVVFYELLTGHRPFRSGSEGELVFEIVNNEQDRPSRVREEVPEPLDALIMHMLEKDPALRFQSMAEVISLLEGVRGTLETSTATLGLTVPALPVLGRRRLLPATAAAGALVIVTLAIVVVLRPPRSVADPRRVAIAVLANRTGDPALDQLGSYIANTLTTQLEGLNLIQVIPFESSFPISRILSGDSPRPPESSDLLTRLAAETGAGTVIGGAYYALDDRNLEFRLEIRDAARGRLMASLEPLRGGREDLGGTVSRLCSRLMGVLAGALDPRFAEWARMSGQPPSLSAFQHFTTGLEFYFRGDRPRAGENFLRAASRDTSYLAPLIWAARMFYMDHTLTGYARADSLLTVVKARRDRLLPAEEYHLDYLSSGLQKDNEATYALAKKAAELYPVAMWYFDAGQSARIANRPREALDFFSRINWRNSVFGDWSAALNQYFTALCMLGRQQQALDIITDLQRDTSIHPLQLAGFKIMILAQQDRWDEVREIEEDLYGDPTFSGRPGFGLGYRQIVEGMTARGVPDQAARVYEKGLAWFESRPSWERSAVFHRAQLAHLHYFAGRLEEAEELFQGLVEQYPEGVEFSGYCQYLGSLGGIDARRGDRGAAEERMAQLLALTPPYLQYRPYYHAARIAVRLGDRERAVDLLRDAYDRGWPAGHEIRTLSADFAPLWDYPPFQALVSPR